MNLIGRIAPVFKANYAADTAYKKLDVVLYEYSLWLALQDTAGNAPPGIPENADLTQPIKNDYWQLYIPGAQVAGGESFVSKTDIAQAPTETDPGKLGISRPDGETITIDEDGTLHGASLDFVGTAAELKAAVAAGNVKAGMTAFIRQGDIDGEGMLVEVMEGTGMSMIGKVEGGKFVPYASMGDKQKGVPLFVFDDKAAWQEEYDAGNVPDGSVIILLRDEEGDGSGTYVTVDGELSLESENPVQNKVIAAEINGVKDKYAGIIAIVKEDGAGAHNSRFSGSYIGDRLEQEQARVIADGTFKELYIGDYWTIGRVNYRIAYLDYWLRGGDVECTKHHAVIVPDTCLYNAQMHNTASGQHEAGAANTTEGGYIGSDMYKTGLNRAKAIINEAFGADHILSHRELLANAVTNGKPSSGVWYDSTVELMNECMVYGSYIFTPACDGTFISFRHTIGKSQLALFALRPDLICNHVDWWLRDVVSGDSFANVNWRGNAGCLGTSYLLGVRPAFGIC